MSTNGGSTTRSGRSESTRGVRLPAVDNEGMVIQPGELGYPLENTPWRVWSFDDPDVLEYNRAVPLEDLHRMTQRDGHMRMLFNMLQWPMRAAEFAIEPDQDGEVEGDFIRAMLTDPPQKGGMTTTMSYIMACMSLAFRDGFQVFEKVIEVRDGFQVLRKLSPRPSRTIIFRYDDHGGLAGVVQKVWYKGEQKRIEIPVEKLLVWTVGKETEPLQGESLFLPAYYHYDKKHRLYYIAHIAAMVGAVPLRVGKVPAGQPKANLAYFREVLQKLGLQGALSIPAGWEVETHSNTTSVLGDILALIEHHDVQASKSMLAQFSNIATEGKGGLGTATSTSELGDLFVVALETHLQDIAQLFNSYLIPYFVDVNFGTGRYPTLRFEPFSDDQNIRMKETFTALFNATSPPLPSMMFEVMREFAETLNLEGIDWDKERGMYEAEQQARQEVKDAERDAQKKALAAGETQNAAPPGLRPPVPAKLGEEGSRKRAEVGHARAVALAELAARSGDSEVGLDAFGYGFTPGAVVHEVDDPSAFYRVRSIRGGMVEVEEFETEEEVDRPFQAARLVFVS